MPRRHPPRLRALAIVVLASLPTTSAFRHPIPRRPHTPLRRQSYSSAGLSRGSSSSRRGPRTPSRPATSTALHASPPPLPDTSDPFLLLGLDPSNPTTDKKEIKRAYKRRALMYHPDVVVTTTSTPEEKRRASEDFAKINAAYEMLSGRGSGGVGVGAGGAGGGGGYQPPHRRSGSYSPGGGRSRSGAAPGASTDWRDYMPSYEEEDAKYDAGGDSFEKIFTDLFTGVAAGAVGAAAGGGGGGGGILKDLIDFLEGNVEGFASGYEDDDSLAALLTVGSLEDVSDEMDDTQLLVSQLETKLDSMEKDVTMIQEEVKLSMRYVEKIELEERLAEIEARKGVVGNYLKKARKRLVKLQARYKELIVQGRADGRAGTGGYYSGSSSSPYSGGASRTDSYGGSSPGSTTAAARGGYGGGARTSGQVPSPSPYPSYSTSAPRSASASSSTGSGVGEEESQSFSRKEGFGSFGRRGGRGTGRGRRGSRGSSSSSVEGEANAGSSRVGAAAGATGTGPGSSTTSDRRKVSYDTSPRPPPSSSRSASSSSIQERKEWTPPVPPHRRKSPNSQAAEDKKRLREIKVDDEFEKLKKELGL